MSLIGQLASSVRAGIDAWLVEQYRQIEKKRGSYHAVDLLSLNPSVSGVQPHTTDQLSHLLVYRVNVYAYAAIKAISQDVSSTPLLVQKRVIKNSKRDWETVAEGDLVDLFDKPNRDESTQQMLERWIASTLLSGNGYLHFAPDIKRLKYIKPSWVRLTMNDDTGEHIGYEIKNRGLIVNEEVDRIVHVRLTDPNGDYYGFPPSEVIKETIMRKVELNKYLRAYFKNFAMLGNILSTTNALTKDQREVLRHEMDRLYSGVDNAGKTAILEGGLSSEKVANNLKDTLPPEIETQIRSEVLTAYGVTPIKLGFLDGASYANAKEQDSTYQRGTCEPMRCLAESALTLQLVPHFGEGLRVVFDRSKVPGLNEDRATRTVWVDRIWRGGLITRNQALEFMEIDPVDDPVIGEEYYTAPTMAEPIDDKEKSLPPVKRVLVSTKLSAKISRRDQWIRHEKALQRHESRIRAVVSRFFREQGERVLENVQRISFKGHAMSLLWMAKDTVDDNDPDKIFDVDKENDLLDQAIDGDYKRIMVSSANEALDAYSIGGSFSIDNPHAQAKLTRLKNRIKNINKTSWGELKGLLSQGLAEKWTIARLESEIRDTFSDWSKSRALTVARTETNGVVSMATIEGYRQNGVEEKEWIATQDDVTREDHANADGQVVPLENGFDIGGVRMEGPGDPNAPAEQVINCRCAVAPVVRGSNE